MSQFFEILILSRDFLGNICHVQEINFSLNHFLMKSDKSLLFPERTNLTKFETWFCRIMTVEDGNVKINVSPIILCTFLLFKVLQRNSLILMVGFNGYSFSKGIIAFGKLYDYKYFLITLLFVKTKEMSVKKFALLLRPIFVIFYRNILLRLFK